MCMVNATHVCVCLLEANQWQKIFQSTDFHPATMFGKGWEQQSSDWLSYIKDPPQALNEEAAVLLIHSNLKF